MTAETARARLACLQELFEQAVELSPGERQSWWTALEQRDPVLASELRGLLAADAETSGPLGDPLGVGAATAGAAVEDDGFAGPRVVGAWQLLGKIGEGGSGVVYLARRVDRPWDRYFALKRLRGEGLSAADHRRIAQEAVVLAQLEHPGVARLVDAGQAPDGTAYLVTEHVAGVPINEHCDRHQLPIAARIELLVKVCAAVQHAHINLVLHRDLKPANILVGADGEPKLLDFGVARLLDAETGAAETTSRALTPSYASPEQLLGARLTTSSDTYSLGVVLFELLTGRRPYGGPEEVLNAMVEAFRDRRPPSASRAVAAGTPDLDVRAARRATTPRALARALRGDLDRILGRALALAPEQRYKSAIELAEELERHRQGLPLRVGPATFGYRVGKGLRRHRLVVANGVLAVSLLLAFAGSEAGRARRATRERDAARLAERRASEVTRVLEQAFTASDPFFVGTREQTARQVLDAAVDRVDRELAGQPALRAQLKRTIGGVYSRLGLHSEGIAQLRGALVLERAEDPRSAATAVGLQELALAHLLAGRHRAAEIAALLSCRLIEELASTDQAHEVAFGVSERVLADVLSEIGRQDEARETVERAIRRHERFLGVDHATLSTDLNSLVMIAYRRGELAEAEQAGRRSLEVAMRSDPTGDASRATVLHNLSAVLRARGKLEEALALNRQVLALRRQLFGPQSPSVANSLNGVALIELDLGRADRAEPAMREALATAEGSVGETHPLTIVVRSNLAEILDAAGKGLEAVRVAERAVALAAAHLPDGYPPKAYAYASGGTIALHAGDLAQARRWLEQAREMRQSAGGSPSDLALGGLALARLAQAEDQIAVAEQGYREYQAKARRIFETHQWQRWWGAVQLADVLNETGRSPEALLLITEAAEALRGQLADGDYRRAVAESVLARARADSDPAASRAELARTALQLAGRGEGDLLAVMARQRAAAVGPARSVDERAPR